MNEEGKRLLDTFERAKNRAAGNEDLIDLLFWIETLVGVGVSPTQAASVWATRKAKEPLIKFGSLSIGAS